MLAWSPLRTVRKNICSVYNLYVFIVISPLTKDVSSYFVPITVPIIFNLVDGLGFDTETSLSNIIYNCINKGQRSYMYDVIVIN